MTEIIIEASSASLNMISSATTLNMFAIVPARLCLRSTQRPVGLTAYVAAELRWISFQYTFVAGTQCMRCAMSRWPKLEQKARAKHKTNLALPAHATHVSPHGKRQLFVLDRARAEQAPCRLVCAIAFSLLAATPQNSQYDFSDLDKALAGSKRSRATR